MNKKKTKDFQQQLEDMLVDEAATTRSSLPSEKSQKNESSKKDITGISFHKIEGSAIIERQGESPVTGKGEGTKIDNDKTLLSAPSSKPVLPPPRSVINLPQAPVAPSSEKNAEEPKTKVENSTTSAESPNWSFSQVGIAVDNTQNAKPLKKGTPILESRNPIPLREPMDMHVDASLVQSEHLRLAQERILELEDMISRLRVENEQLVAAGETLRNRTEELFAKSETSESDYREKLGILQEEKVLLEGNLRAKQKEVQELNLKVDELEMRLNTDIKRVRVRERELENRLELIKIEGATVLRSKDEMILELKRKLDQLAFEIENYRSKGKELNKKLETQQDRARRTVKALRLALSMLDGDEAENNPIKKAD